MNKKLYISLIFSNLVVIKTLVCKLKFKSTSLLCRKQSAEWGFCPQKVLYQGCKINNNSNTTNYPTFPIYKY